MVRNGTQQLCLWQWIDLKCLHVVNEIKSDTVGDCPWGNSPHLLLIAAVEAVSCKPHPLGYIFTFLCTDTGSMIWTGWSVWGDSYWLLGCCVFLSYRRSVIMWKGGNIWWKIFWLHILVCQNWHIPSEEVKQVDIIRKGIQEMVWGPYFKSQISKFRVLRLFLEKQSKY